MWILFDFECRDQTTAANGGGAGENFSAYEQNDYFKSSELSVILPSFFKSMVIDLKANTFYAVGKDGTKTKTMHVDEYIQDLKAQGTSFTRQRGVALDMGGLCRLWRYPSARNPQTHQESP